MGVPGCKECERLAGKGGRPQNHGHARDYRTIAEIPTLIRTEGLRRERRDNALRVDFCTMCREKPRIKNRKGAGGRALQVCEECYAKITGRTAKR